MNSLLENQYNYGFSMVVIENSLKNLPRETSKFVLVNETGSGMFSDSFKKDDIITIQDDNLDIDMRKVAEIVSNIPIKSKDADSELPGMLPFLEMYNVGKIEQLNIRNRWKTSDPMSTLQAPVGVHTNGELFKLDLHEKFDGPHGLIAGMTGSGKSETIITYLLSLAVNYSPDEVQFVLIDYKGGGLAGAFENRKTGMKLPHLIGTITNLDTSEMKRTLVSIKSELQRRQRLFNEAKENLESGNIDIYK